MPQYADPSVLLQAKGITLPGPMDLATQGVTLSNLMQQNEAGALTLQEKRAMLAASQDPRMMALLFGGASSSPGGVPNFSDADLAKYGPAIPQLAKTGLEFQKGYADIDKSSAEALKARNDVQTQRMQALANFAYSGARDPTQGNIIGYLTLFRRSGLPEDAFGPLPDTSATPEVWAKYFAGAASSMTSAPEQTGIPKTQAETKYISGPQTAGTQATTAKTNIEAGLAPTETNIRSFSATTARGQLEKPEFYTDPNTGADMVRQTVMTPQGPKLIVRPVYGVQAPGSAGAGESMPPGTSSGAPAAPTSVSGALPPRYQDTTAGPQIPSAAPSAMPGAGQRTVRPPVGPVGSAQEGAPKPLQTGGMSLAQSEQTKETAKVVGNLTKEIPAAVEAKNTIANLRQLDSQGVYAGGVRGSEFFKSLANDWGSMPFASDKMREELSNTQTWDTQAGELVFQKIQSMPGASRVAGPLLNSVKGIKPNTLMTPQARQQVYDLIDRLLDIQIGMAKQSASVSAAPGATNLNAMPDTVPQPPKVIRHPNGVLEITTD